MVRIALTGGIASGKTLVSDEFARLGAAVIDADVLAREVVEPDTPGLEAIRSRFGDGVLQPDGSLDRGRLGEVVFADDQSREDLNAIVHPLVRARSRELESLALADVVVHAIPLLVETGQEGDFDGVVVVDVPVETQVSRLMHRNGLDTEQARARVRAQAARAERRAAATWLIDNSGDVAHTVDQVVRLWEGPLLELRRAEKRAAFRGLPSQVRGPEPTADLRAARQFIAAQVPGDDAGGLDLGALGDPGMSVRVLRMRGAIVGAVLVDQRGDPVRIHGPWVVPGLRQGGPTVLLDAARELLP